MTNNKLKLGEIYLAFVTFTESLNSDNPKGKVRPVVIFEDPDDHKLFACKVTTRVNKPIAQKLGYTISDWKESGLNAPSIVSCDKENVREIEPNSIIKYIGELTERDIRGMLIKHMRVQALEHQREQNNSLGR